MNFASSRFLVRDQVIRELRETIDLLTSNHPDIQAVYLFGSFASGIPTPKSDADLLIVAEKSSWEDLQTEFLTVSVPVDYYVVKPEVFEQRLTSGRGLVGVAARNSIRLF